MPAKNFKDVYNDPNSRKKFSGATGLPFLGNEAAYIAYLNYATNQLLVNGAEQTITAAKEAVIQIESVKSLVKLLRDDIQKK